MPLVRVSNGGTSTTPLYGKDTTSSYNTTSQLYFGYHPYRNLQISFVSRAGYQIRYQLLDNSYNVIHSKILETHWGSSSDPYPSGSGTFTEDISGFEADLIRVECQRDGRGYNNGCSITVSATG